MYDFIQIIHKDTNETKIVQELDDWHFDQGYRVKRYLSNSEVDFPEVYAQQQEEMLIRMAGSSTEPMVTLSDGSSSGESIFWTPVEIY